MREGAGGDRSRFGEERHERSGGGTSGPRSEEVGREGPEIGTRSQSQGMVYFMYIRSTDSLTFRRIFPKVHHPDGVVAPRYLAADGGVAGGRPLGDASHVSPTPLESFPSKLFCFAARERLRRLSGSYGRVSSSPSSPPHPSSSPASAPPFFLATLGLWLTASRTSGP